MIKCDTRHPSAVILCVVDDPFINDWLQFEVDDGGEGENEADGDAAELCRVDFAPSAGAGLRPRKQLQPAAHEGEHKEGGDDPRPD